MPPQYFDSDAVLEQYKTTYSYNPSGQSLRDTEYSVYRLYRRQIENWLDKDRTSLLEIGAGPGAFIEEIKPFVHRLVAVELNASQAVHCRTQNQVEVFETPIDDLSFGAEFDMVCMFSVLEHVTDPAAFLRRAMSFVKPGGRLCLTVPNRMDPLLSVYDVPSYAEMWYRPVHLLNFTESAIQHLLARAGLPRPEIRFLQGYSLSNHMYWMHAGKPQPSVDVGYRFTFPVDLAQPQAPVVRELEAFFAEADRQYRKILADHGHTDMLMVTLTKPSASSV